MSFLKRRCTRRLLAELYLRCGHILPSFCVNISLVYLIACAGHAPWWQPRTQRNRSSKHVIAHFSRLVRCCVPLSTRSEQNVQRRRIRLPFQGKLASLASEFLDGQLSKLWGSALFVYLVSRAVSTGCSHWGQWSWQVEPSVALHSQRVSISRYVLPALFFYPNFAFRGNISCIV
jgi:hypothetical protein